MSWQWLRHISRKKNTMNQPASIIFSENYRLVVVMLSFVDWVNYCLLLKHFILMLTKLIGFINKDLIKISYRGWKHFVLKERFVQCRKEKLRFRWNLCWKWKADLLKCRL